MQINWDKITDNTAVWCKTIADAKAFLEAAEKRGVEWRAGDTLTSKTNWTYYKDRTCYNIASSNKLYFDKQSHYIDCGYTVVDYQDLFTTKPRICEVLGVEVGERFAYPGMVGEFYITEGGTLTAVDDGTEQPMMWVSTLINCHKEIIRKPKFTPEEIDQVKMVAEVFGRKGDFERRIDGRLTFRHVHINEAFFPSIRPGQTVSIDEILGDTATPTPNAARTNTPIFGDLTADESRELLERWNEFSGNECDNEIKLCLCKAGCDRDACPFYDNAEDNVCSEYVRSKPREALEILRGINK